MAQTHPRQPVNDMEGDADNLKQAYAANTARCPHDNSAVGTDPTQESHLAPGKW